MENNLVSKSEYAKLRGCSPSAVTRAIREGRISTVAIDGSEMINPESADVQWQRNTRPRVDSSSAANADARGAGQDAISMDETLFEARRRLMVSEANQAETKEAETKGKLLDRAGVDRAFYEAARGLRDGMTNCSRRLAAEVANLTTPSECEEVIAKELRHLLDAFSKEIAQKIQPAQALSEA